MIIFGVLYKILNNNNKVLPYMEAHLIMLPNSLISSVTNSTTNFINVPIELFNYSKIKITFKYEVIGSSNTKIMSNLLGISKEMPQELKYVLNLIFYNDKNTMNPIRTVEIGSGNIFRDYLNGSSGRFILAFFDEAPIIRSLDNIILKNQNAKFCVLNLVLTPSDKASFILNKCEILMKITPYV